MLVWFSCLADFSSHLWPCQLVLKVNSNPVQRYFRYNHDLFMYNFLKPLNFKTKFENRSTEYLNMMTLIDENLPQIKKRIRCLQYWLIRFLLIHTLAERFRDRKLHMAFQLLASEIIHKFAFKSILSSERY